MLFSRRTAEVTDAISRVQALLEVLKLSKVDLGPAHALLDEARAALASKDYPRALESAARAEALAPRLEERYRGAQRAMVAVRNVAKQLKALRIPVAALDAAIEEARGIARAGTVEDGIRIPNYLQARVALEAALEAGKVLLVRAQAVANEVFTAELALEAVQDLDGAIDAESLERGVLRECRGLIERATEFVAKGQIDDAEVAAKAAQDRANRCRLSAMDAVAALKAGERTLAELRGNGAVASGPDRLLEQGRLLLRKARLKEAREVLERADQEAQRLAADVHRTTKTVKEVEHAIGSFAKAGGLPDDAERYLRDARKALAEGRYSRAEELAEEARRSIGKRLEMRERLARAIADTKKRVEALREGGIDFATDVEEMVIRAEREFENGDFVNSSEDLKIASLLMGPATRRVHGDKGRAPEPRAG